MAWSHNLKAQEAEGPQQRRCGGERREGESGPNLRGERGGRERGREGERTEGSLPRSSRFLWKQMKTWSTCSCSSANSSRRAKLRKEEDIQPRNTSCHLADVFIQSDLQLIRLSRRHFPLKQCGVKGLAQGPQQLCRSYDHTRDRTTNLAGPSQVA